MKCHVLNQHNVYFSFESIGSGFFVLGKFLKNIASIYLGYWVYYITLLNMSQVVAEKLEGYHTPTPAQGDFVTFRDPVAEVASLISELHVSDQEEEFEEEEEEEVVAAKMHQTVLEWLQANLNETNEKIRSLEADFRDSIESALTREKGFRQDVDTKLSEMESNMQESMGRLERAIVNGFLRQDVKWGKLNKMKSCSTRHSTSKPR